MITAGWLRAHLAELNDDAAVTVSINGCLFDVAAVGTESHDHPVLPRVALQLGNGYEYRHRIDPGMS